MPDAPSPTATQTWLLFALLTVLTWGVYGVFLHIGTVGMQDPALGMKDPHFRMKAFLFVGIAYFLTAVLAPLVILKSQGGAIDFWNYPSKGLWWSLIAGIVGAVGALGVLLAFGAKGKPPEVMSIIFAGAPIVNAITALVLHPPEGGLKAMRWQFFAGIVFAAVGGYLVAKFKDPIAAAAPARTASMPAAPGAAPDAPRK
ncbi:MAG: hypothetical protein FJ386_00405 [Verrucomicrobia bacterium]|nr:hypothetical protein [Verrucomicrobiota bacterium]